MAAVTPATVLRESVGSMTLFIAQFAAITSGATGDTWATGLGNTIVGAWAVATTAGAGKALTTSFLSGTVTVNSEIGATGAYVYVLAKA
jgi:hypothetical protein